MGAGGRRFGIRARVVASFLVLLIAAEVVSVAVLHEVGTDQIDQQVENDLREVADDLEIRLLNEQDDLGRDGGETLRSVLEQFLQSRPAGDQEAYLAIVGGEPFAVSAGAPVALASLPTATTWTTARETTTGEVETLAGPLRWLSVPILAGGELLGVFVVTQVITDQQAALRETVALVSALTVLVLLAACLLAWGAAGRALRPLHRLAVTTRSVADGDDLDARVAVQGHDEVADLGASVNGMLDRLQRSFDSQKQFLDDAGHELRAPLTIVRGHVELLDDDPEVRAGEVALIVDEIDRMERLVADLRTLARSERPDFLDPTDLEVGPFVDDLIRKADSIAPRRWAAQVEVEGTVRADPQRLTQAMLNLVENAANVTATGDRITISARDRDGALVLAVHDDGPGIAIDDQATLFDRTGRAVRRRVSGTGLGLPIVAAVARAHGGAPSVTSEVGVGTTVEITIPGLRPARTRGARPVPLADDASSDAHDDRSTTDQAPHPNDDRALAGDEHPPDDDGNEPRASERPGAHR